MGDQPVRPTVVTAAYWLWFAASAVLVLMGLAWLFVDIETLRSEQPDLQEPGRLRDLLRMFGGIALAAGIFIAYVAGRVRKGEPRFRRALVAFSIMIILYEAATFPLAGMFALLVIVPLAAACFLVYRPTAQPWFVE
ncbi:hypothetical protein [Lolliginicoccus levis]|uniref:hypothetical protein n=1 Tax=Lolliginicoccus levis TaxID=2919542 RepID=UPI00241D6752|nr:hypothetical protein [Lolliginicoccus levis]